jgi:hypothetical protein
MFFARALDAVQQAIAKDDVAADDPFLCLMVRSRLSFCCVVESPNRGNPIAHRDPSPAQFAAFWNKQKALTVIWDLSIAEGAPAEEIFYPTTSNTSANLLVLAVQNPDQQTDTLRFLIEAIQRYGISIDSCTAHSNTALFEAVEMRNADAVRLLIRDGADPLFEAETRLCPLVRAVVLDRTLASEMWNPPDDRDTWIGRAWNPETLLADPDGRPLSEILVERGFDALGQFVRDLEATPGTIPTPSIPTSDPTRVIEEEEEDVGQAATADVCENCGAATGSLRACDGCGKIFCEDHMDGHLEDSPECGRE